jgi:ATP adenylyltransferase/5',5'''-P-1,P-4-tetraphosphate phosphorylase II
MAEDHFNIDGLFFSQLQKWELARANYKALQKVNTKDFVFGDFTVRVQFNPGRIISSAAKVDTESIQQRKCFLCPQNLPPVQVGIPFGTQYQILVNPYPIFPCHLTIAAYSHADQLIFNRYGDMLDMAKSLNGYTLFYNGPKCGASAPDHAHFQAGIKGFLPFEREIKNIGKEIIYHTDELILYAIRDYLRNCFLLETENKNEALACFRKLYALLELKDTHNEPMMNILTWYENKKYYSCIFPREKHRPECFFALGDENLLVSPAAVDLAGVFITPLKKDYDRITKKNIVSILNEICISNEKMMAIANSMKII